MTAADHPHLSTAQPLPEDNGERPNAELTRAGVVIIGAVLAVILALLLGIAAGKKRGAAGKRRGTSQSKGRVVQLSKAIQPQKRHQLRDTMQLLSALNRLLSP